MDKSNRILIVDDTLERVIIIERVLVNLGLVFKRCSGLEDISKLKKTYRFDLAIINLQNRESDGLVIADTLRKLKQNAQVPIMFLSLPIKDEDYLIKVYEREMVDLMVTPIIPEMLRSKVQTFLKFGDHSNR